MNTLLLVRLWNDTHHMLEAGTCGARVPIVHRYRWKDQPDHWSTWKTVEVFNPETVEEHALVLVWDGKPVPEGCDRAARVLGIREGFSELYRAPWLTLAPALDIYRRHRWRLSPGGTYIEYSANGNTNSQPWLVPALKDVLEHIAGTELEPPWALATICANRLGGEVVVIS